MTNELPICAKAFQQVPIKTVCSQKQPVPSKAATQFAGYTEILGITPPTAACKCCFVSIYTVKLKVESREGWEQHYHGGILGYSQMLLSYFCPVQLQGLPGWKQDQAFTSVWVMGIHRHLELTASTEGSGESGLQFLFTFILALFILAL